MKILHYALGFPPYRTGGSTKFCLDLMGQQKADGHQVALIWPGRMGFFRRQVSIRSGEYCQIHSYEICGPLPVPYDEGISQCHLFTEDAGREAYKRLLEDLRPDVLHVHTFMGLHRSLLESAKERGIRCVFTSHDHFPVCPKVTMVRHGQVCPSVGGCSDCGECNRGALSIARIKILQSVFYRNFKETAIVCKLRERHRDRYLRGYVSGKGSGVMGTAEDHKSLRRYYHSLLKKMDMIHYNSTVTRSVYERYFHLAPSVVIGISHKDIQDRRKRKEFSPDRRRFSYLGPQGEAKGFFLLQTALDRLWEKDKQFSLNIYFRPMKMSPYMRWNKRYTYMELEKVFDDTDLLIVPSIWYETFGYVVLEALSYGVPVLMSGHVGARDILAQGAGVIIEGITAEKLYETLSRMTSGQLKEMNEIILEKQNIPTLQYMAKEIEDKCYLDAKICRKDAVDQ